MDEKVGRWTRIEERVDRVIVWLGPQYRRATIVLIIIFLYGAWSVVSTVPSLDWLNVALLTCILLTSGGTAVKMWRRSEPEVVCAIYDTRPADSDDPRSLSSEEITSLEVREN